MAVTKEDGVHDHATKFCDIYEGMLAAEEKRSEKRVAASKYDNTQFCKNLCV